MNRVFQHSSFQQPGKSYRSSYVGDQVIITSGPSMYRAKIYEDVVPKNREGKYIFPVAFNASGRPDGRWRKLEVTSRGFAERISDDYELYRGLPEFVDRFPAYTC